MINSFFTSASHLANLWDTLDARVEEYIKLIPAGAGKLRHNRPFLASLEPVPRIRRNRILLARLKLDLVEDCIVRLAASRDTRLRSRRRLPFDIQPDLAPAAAERLHLAWVCAHRWVSMLWARLPGKQDQLLGTVPV